MSQEQCAYCGRPATTRDHVPPKKLFTPPLPGNLITVPACDNCNNRASEDDEAFQNELSIMAGSFGESVNAAERLQPTMRSIRRNRATLGRMVSGAQLVERYSPGGICLGHGYAVPIVRGVQEVSLLASCGAYIGTASKPHWLMMPGWHWYLSTRENRSGSAR
jgi:hypothetical protein